MSKKIFIVENEFIIAEDLAMMVEQMGHQTLGHARSLPDAIDRIAASLPDLVLLDVQLSAETDGLKLAGWLRERQIPFIYVSSFSDLATRQAMEATSPIGYLSKPFDQDDVQDALQKAFEALRC